MAAGLAIDPDHVSAFRRGLSVAVSEQLATAEPEPEVVLDGYVALGEVSLSLVEDLARIAPFGAGNPPLTLAVRDVRVVAQRPMGRNGDHLRLTVEDADRVERTAVWWRWGGAEVPNGRIDLAFTARINRFRGKVEVQIVWQGARPVELEEAREAVVPTGALELLDHRGHRDARGLVRALASEATTVAVWSEPVSGVDGAHHRLDLPTADSLVIWSSPPSWSVLEMALRRVGPRRLVLLSRDRAVESADAFVAYLLGLIKHVLRRRGGRTTLADLAAAMGHREVAVRKGLDWLAARGEIRLEEADEIVLELGRGVTSDAQRARVARQELQAVLAETVAFRQYLATADAGSLRTNLAQAAEKALTGGGDLV
jgi:single-stranded-DNA-specific exonuclease